MNYQDFFGPFFTGINYWCSKNAINMWEDYDEKVVEKDFQLLSEAGITHLRVFPTWHVFQPLKAIYGPGSVYEYRLGETPLPNTPAGRAGVSEEACRKFENFCSLAEKYNLKLIVGLITGHMSFRVYAPEAFCDRQVLSDPEVIKWQLKYVKYFVSRFKNQSSIIGWDLGNEVSGQSPKTSVHAFHLWCETISDAIKVTDPTRPVISGFASFDEKEFVENSRLALKPVGNMCDINTVHPYAIFKNPKEPVHSMIPVLELPFECAMSESISGIPTFVQEYGAIGYQTCTYDTEADFYKGTVLSSVAHNCHGVMWWCAFDQGHLDYAPYDWNNIGSNYGFFTKDLQAKPIVEVNKELKGLIEKIPGKNLPKHTTNATVLVSRDDYALELNTYRFTYALAKRANLDVDFAYVLDEIPDADLYIYPGVAGSKAITRRNLDKLLTKVENGSVLYISLSNAFFRDINTIAGVEFEHRIVEPKATEINFNGVTLPVTAEQSFLIGNGTSAEILARDNEGTPVFFKNKYGKGYIYLLTAPVEKYLGNRSGAFYKEDVADYSVIYREIAECANVKRIADSSSPFVRLTEHKINENEYYIFAINYSHTERETIISLPENVEISSVFGNLPDKFGKITLAKNDGALIYVKLKN